MKVPEGIKAAGLVWLAGFGALTVFALIRPGPARLPGLYDFASATWGDGIAVPLMTGSLVHAARTLPPATRDAAVATMAGLLGAGLGVASQAYWLSVDTPQLNWSFPRPHHFNAAGWYHAVYLVVMCGIAAALWALALNRAVRAARVRRSLFLALAAGAAFLALLAADAQAGRLP
jgi:hypothetical protein